MDEVDESEGLTARVVCICSKEVEDGKEVLLPIFEYTAGGQPVGLSSSDKESNVEEFVMAASWSLLQVEYRLRER